MDVSSLFHRALSKSASDVSERTPELDSLPTPRVSGRMQRTKQRDTAAEMVVRRAAHAAGLRYRVNVRPIAEVRSRADLVFSRAKVAVYVDGCFWHRCPIHGTEPSKNSAYWSAKLDRNVERDRRVDALLKNAGWIVVRIWEHVEADEAVRLIRRALQQRG